MTLTSPRPAASRVSGQDPGQKIGVTALIWILVAAGSLHLSIFISHQLGLGFVRLPEAFALTEGISGLTCMLLLIPFLRARGQQGPWLEWSPRCLVLLVAARWLGVALLAGAGALFYETVSLCLYIPLLVIIANILDPRGAKVLVTGFAVAIGLGGLILMQREDLREFTVLTDWRLPLALLVAIGVMHSLAGLWRTTITDLSLGLNREIELAKRATTDDLTGLKTRAVGESVLMESVEAGLETAVLLIDVDHFKLINDTLGHLQGDEVLRRITAVVKQTTRASDCVCRWGGEEFLVVLTGEAARSALGAAESLRSRIVGQRMLDGRPVTVSIGVAMIRTGETHSELLARADAALYLAKGAGRNRVQMAA